MDKLKVAVWNGQSVKSKSITQTLGDFISKKIDFTLIKETFLKPDLSLYIENYTIHRIHWPGETREGAVAKPIQHRLLPHNKTSIIEAIGIRVQIVIADLNAQVGQEETYWPTVGSFNVHQLSNENGLRLINFASSKHMSIRSTFFQHRHRYTGRHTKGGLKTQIDHVLIDGRDFSESAHPNDWCVLMWQRGTRQRSGKRTRRCPSQTTIVWCNKPSALQPLTT